jgi:hypothetical protein
MAVTAANFKLYQCTTWTEGSTHGGAINTSTGVLADSGDQVIFDDVTNAERLSGDTEYRKVFFRNENTETVSIKCWISTAYTATNQAVSIVAGTAEDVQTDADDYTYVTPTAIDHEDVIDCGSLAQNDSKAIWIKRVVTEGGNGITGDSFALTFGMY